MSTTGPITIAVEKNRQRALDLKANGFTFQEIGDKLGLSKTRAWELVNEALEEIREENNLRAVQLRDMALRRYHKIRMKLWPDRDKPDVANALIRLEQREADLLGLDAPKKIEQSGPNGGPIRLEGGRVQLTDDERRNRLRELALTGSLPAGILTPPRSSN